ncbi:hypothetical protein, partial [Martelella alba]
MKDKQEKFEEWKNNEREKIPLDCGCVSVEVFWHWLKKSFNNGYDVREPEIADLKKQLSENQEFFDGLHDAIRPEENKSQPIQAVSVP